jgi:hypothetical protein
MLGVRHICNQYTAERMLDRCQKYDLFLKLVAHNQKLIAFTLFIVKTVETP